MNKIISDIRSFNRYYTSIIGVLDKHFLNSRLSLPEARVLFEIRNNRLCTSKAIISSIKIDRGYLSRILKNFEFKKIIIKKRCRTDSRNIFLKLTAKGRKLLECLSAAQNRQISDLINGLTKQELKLLITYMNGIKKILNSKR